MLTNAVKAGTYYKMRDGRKAYVAYITTPRLHTEHPALGLHEIEPGEWVDYSWRLDGTRKLAPASHELMEVWIDPPPLVDAWAVVVRTTGEIYSVGRTREKSERTVSTYYNPERYRIAHLKEVET